MSKTYHCSQITKGKVDSAPAMNIALDVEQGTITIL